VLDPITTSAIIAGGGQLLGGVYSNWLGGTESRRARQFSERMAGSAWQRQMVDMRLAGVNPAVAFSHGGAAMPSAPTAQFDNPVGGAVSSAVQAAGMRKQLELLDAQILKTSAEAQGARADSAVKQVDAEMANAKWDYYFDGVGAPRGALKALLDAEFNSNVASSARSISEAELARFSIPERKAIAQLFEQVGGGGKAVQLLMPLLLNMSQGYARGRF